jgi:hypothetical protein
MRQSGVLRWWFFAGSNGGFFVDSHRFGEGHNSEIVTDVAIDIGIVACRMCSGANSFSAAEM